MRLWHSKLLPYLPRMQLLSQKRECDLIWKDLANGKKTNHILINYIWEYEDYLSELYCYYLLLKKEFENRKYKFNFSKNVFKIRPVYPLENNFFPFENHHNLQYLNQCYYNLEEKYVRRQKDFDYYTFLKLNNFYRNYVVSCEKDNFRVDYLKSAPVDLKKVYFDEFIINEED